MLRCHKFSGVEEYRLSHFHEVRPSILLVSQGEGLVRAGDDRATDVRVGFEAFEGGADFVCQPVVQRIQALGRFGAMGPALPRV